MMLQIDHRENHDVDIFLSDPQLLAFLDPQKRDFKFEIWPTAYDGDGVSFQKLAFKDVGEIDFIVGHAMTSSPPIQAIIEGEATLLETIPEIIAKKIYYRGSSHKATGYFRHRRGGRTAHRLCHRRASILSRRSSNHA